MWFSRSSTHGTSNSNKFNANTNNCKNLSSPGGASITSSASSVTRLNNDGIGNQDDDNVTVDLFASVRKAPEPSNQRAGAKDGEGSSGLRYFTQDLTQGDTIPSPASQTLNILDAFNNHSTDSTLYLSQKTRLTSTVDVRGEKRSQRKGVEPYTTTDELDLTVYCFCRSTANTKGVDPAKSVAGKKHHSLCKYHPKYNSYVLDLTRSGALKGCPSCRQLLRYDISHTQHLPTCRRNNDFKKKEQILTKKAKEAFTEITPAAGTNKTNETLSFASGGLNSNFDVGSNKNSPEMDAEYVNHATLSSFFKHSHHIKAGVGAGCQRCIELSSKGTSNVRHDVTCPSGRKEEGVTGSQGFLPVTPLIREIETMESTHETDVSEKYASNWQQRMSDSLEEITCGPSQNSANIPYQQSKLGFPNSYQFHTITTRKTGKNDLPTSKHHGMLRNDNHPSFLLGETNSQESYVSSQEQRCEKLQIAMHPRIPAPFPRDSICTHSKNGGSRWMPCGNPWGPIGYLEGDKDAIFGLPTSSPPIDGMFSSRYVQEPFTISSYIQTHSGGLGNYSVLSLRRDAFALQSWGFVTCLHEFGGACLVKEVTPCSPADAAVDIGNSQMEIEHPLGGGLRVNDMILCINGKVVGGMSEVDFLTELELCGPTMTLVIARCFDSNLNRSTLQSITENEASHWAFNEPLHWTEFGSSGSMYQNDRLSASSSYMHWESNDSFSDTNINENEWNSSSQQGKLRNQKFFHGSQKLVDSRKKGQEGQIIDEATVQASQIHNTIEADDDCCIPSTQFGGKNAGGIASKRSYEQTMTNMSQKPSKIGINARMPFETPTESVEYHPISQRGNSMPKESKSIEKDPAPLICGTIYNPSQRLSFSMIRMGDAPLYTAERAQDSECSSKPVVNSSCNASERTIFNNYGKDNEMQQVSYISRQRELIETSKKKVNRVAESPELQVEMNYESGEDKSTGSIGICIQPPFDKATDLHQQGAATNTQKLDLLVHIAEKTTKELNDNPVLKTKQKQFTLGEDESVNISLYEGEEPWLSCICGKTHPSPIKVFWIQCDGCSSWYNVSHKCCGFDQDQAKILVKWHCPACIKKMSGDNAALKDCARSAKTNASVRKERPSQVKRKEEKKGRKRIFSVNELVVVNYNLTGDVGKVVKVHIDYNEKKEKMISYDIRYLLGRGTERCVDEEWVTPFDNSAYACDGTRRSRGTSKKRILVDLES